MMTDVKKKCDIQILNKLRLTEMRKVLSDAEIILFSNYETNDYYGLELEIIKSTVLADNLHLRSIGIKYYDNLKESYRKYLKANSYKPQENDSQVFNDFCKQYAYEMLKEIHKENILIEDKNKKEC